uniref:Uncharacterized protein n=2 Tax=Auxenochlorella protothecoides TaxID=3075 RepID=A0A1D2A9M4_AUXPR
MRAASDKIREADEIAKVYWAARDLSKELEAHAKELAKEAAEAAKEAERKRAAVDKLDDRADGAERAAEEALQRKAELEREAQALLGSKASAEDRAAQLEREAAARRAQAGKHEEIAVSKRTEAERVVIPVVPDSDLARRAEEARRAAAAAAAKKDGLDSDVERLQKLKLEAEAASQDKLSSVTTYRDEALALKQKEEEHWARAKEHGDAARGISNEETKRRLQAVGSGGTTAQHSEVEHQKVTATSNRGRVESSESGQREEITTTNLADTVPSKPKGTSAGRVDLPVKETTEQYRKEEKAKQESTIKQ